MSARRATWGRLSLTFHLELELLVTEEHGYVPEAGRPKKTKYREDLDLLLYDWGLHHLHLSTTVEPDGFVTRSDTLLFAALLPREAYLIDALPHDPRSFYLRRLLEIVLRNWPDSGVLLPSLSGLRLRREFSEEEAGELRDAGVSANAVEIDGTVWMPRDSVSVTGGSLRAVRTTNAIVHAAERVQARLQEDPGHVYEYLENTDALPSQPRWKFVIDEVWLGIAEQATGTTLILGNLAQHRCRLSSVAPDSDDDMGAELTGSFDQSLQEEVGQSVDVGPI